MCCKKLLELHLDFFLYSTYSSFLVINVCNHGKTLCSPCVIRTTNSHVFRALLVTHQGVQYFVKRLFNTNLINFIYSLVLKFYSSVHNSLRYAYSTPKDFKQFFYVQESIIKKPFYTIYCTHRCWAIKGRNI